MVGTSSAPAQDPSAAGSASSTPGIRLPGETGIWVLVIGDMVAFAVFFGVFMHSRGSNVVMFDESRRNLHVGYAVVNTVLLLSSSLFVALAVRAYRAANQRLAPRLIVFAAVCGLGFVANKAIEYHDKFENGITFTTNTFYLFFFTITGIHLFHVIIGLIGLAFVWRNTRRPERAPGNLLVIEVGASFWHMVDLLWIIIFPLLYLLR